MQATLIAILSKTQMETASAQASYFLPSWDQRQCSIATQELKDKIEAARLQLLPKKKFAFSKKVSRVKGSELSLAASEGMGAAPVSAGGTSANIGTAHLLSHPQITSTAVNGETTSASTFMASTETTHNHPSSSPSSAAIATDRDVALVKEGRGLMGLRGSVIVLDPETIGGRDYVLIDLQGCSIYLMGHLPALRLLGLVDCLIVAGPVTGACFVDTALRCQIHLASYQVRIHRSIDTDFHLRVKSKPIVEHTSRVRFSPLLLAAMTSECAGDDRDAQVMTLMHKHKLGEETGMFSHVEDFGWIKATHSPNWSLIPEAEASPVVIPWAKKDPNATGPANIAAAPTDSDEI